MTPTKDAHAAIAAALAYGSLRNDSRVTPQPILSSHLHTVARTA